MELYCATPLPAAALMMPHSRPISAGLRKFTAKGPISDALAVPDLVLTDDSKYLPRNEIFENVPISDYAFAIHEPFDLTRNPVSVSFVD